MQDTVNPKTIEQLLACEIRRRRTFAIISHPDAGRTTLTEKLLLFGGAIQMAGTVKAHKSGRFASSDWMATNVDGNLVFLAEANAILQLIMER